MPQDLGRVPTLPKDTEGDIGQGEGVSQVLTHVTKCCRLHVSPELYIMHRDTATAIIQCHAHGNGMAIIHCSVAMLQLIHPLLEKYHYRV